MSNIFVIANQKGGVGKTTTTVNLAAGLAAQGQRVLLVDLDPQGNASMGSGIDKHTLEFSVYQVLVGLATIPQARQRSEAGRYDVLPANRDLAGAEVELVDLEHRENRLKLALAEVEADYDFVLIDCPPSLSLLTLNGLCAAHGVVVPMQCEYFALEGLSDLVNTIKQVHANLNRDLKVIGLLRVMFDPRVTLQQQVSAQLESHFGDKVFKTVIPRNVRLAEAPSYGMPGVAHVEVAGHQHGLHGLSEIEQAQQVRHRAARTPYRFRRLLVRELEFTHQARNALRLFQRVEIFALDVLDQRHGSG